MKKYPYSFVNNIVCVSSSLDEKKKQQGTKQQKNPLKEMFPWIQPRSKEHLSTYQIEPIKSQQNQPFYIRFNLRHSQLANLPQLKAKIDDLLTKLTQKKKNNKLAFNEDKNFIPSLDFLNTCNGYIFTGIAKTSITPHEIFDTLFHTSESDLQDQTQNKIAGDDNSSISEGSNFSEMVQSCREEGHMQVSNHIKLSWDFKYHSYEYFRFINKSYQYFKSKYQKQLLPQQVSKAVSYEMFPYGKARKFTYFEGIERKQIDQKQYFDYFFELFQNHSQQIHQKTEENKQNQTDTCNKSSNLQIYHQSHHIRQFDFESYLTNKFKGTDISYKSFQNMIAHNKKRYKQIMQNFPLKRKKQRAQLLGQLINENQLIGNKIRLIQLCGQFKENSNENDQYMILQTSQEQNDPSQVCGLKTIIDIIIQQAQHPQGSNTTIYDQFNLRWQSVFIDLTHYLFYEGEYRPLRFVTYDPLHLQYSSSRIITPIFSRAIEKMLGLDRLPKTAEQQILNSTPNFQLNIYEKVQYILSIFRQAEQSNKLRFLCEILTDENSKFILKDDLQRIEEKNQQLQSQIIRLLGDYQYDFKETQGLAVSIQNLRLRLLQLAMIKYEVQKRQRTFVYDSQSNQAYNASKLNHHKKIQSILLILMIKVGIINKINYIGQYHLSQELRIKYYQIQNSYIDFLRTLMPLKLKEQEDLINLDIRDPNPLPLSKYFQPIFYHHSLFSLKNKLYCNFFQYKNMSELEILIIGETHKMVIIKELLRISNYEYRFEDEQIRSLFLTINKSLSKFSERKRNLNIMSNSQKNEEEGLKLQINDFIKSKTKSFKSSFKKLQQLSNQYQLLSKKMQKPETEKQQKKENNINTQINTQAINFMNKLKQLVLNIQKLQVKFEKIYWDLFSNLYERIAKYQNEKEKDLCLYYNILLYFCCYSKRLSIRQLFKNPATLKWTAEQLQKKIFSLKNICIQMILQQKM